MKLHEKINYPAKRKTFLTLIFLAIFQIILSPLLASDYVVPEELGPKEFDYEIVDIFVQSGEKGIITAFNAAPDLHASHLQLSMHANEKQPIEASFMIGNYTDEAKKFLIIMLIDYGQTSRSLDNDILKGDLISLEPGERKVLPIKIKPLNKGAHNLTILAIDKTNDDDSQIYTYRANIYVESDRFTSNNIQQVTQKSHEYNLPKVVLNHKSNLASFEPPEIPGKSPTPGKVYAHISNTNDKKMNYALILFSNGTQIPLSEENNPHPIFYQLSPKNIGVIELNVPKNNNTTSLWALVVENPNVKLEESRGVIAQVESRTYKSNNIVNNN